MPPAAHEPSHGSSHNQPHAGQFVTVEQPLADEQLVPPPQPHPVLHSHDPPLSAFTTNVRRRKFAILSVIGSALANVPSAGPRLYRRSSATSLPSEADT